MSRGSGLPNARSSCALHQPREPAQLAEITEPAFPLCWDFVDYGSHRETLIKHGDDVIFAEPALYEGYERFIEVSEILRIRASFGIGFFFGASDECGRAAVDPINELLVG